MRTYYLLIPLLVLFTSYAHANDIKNNSESIPSASKITSQPLLGTRSNNVNNVRKDNTEAMAYKTLYENEKDSNKTIIETMQWAIGLVFTILIGLFGSQLFFQVRVNQKEVNSIRSENDKRISDNISTLQSNLESQIKEMRSQATQEFKEIQTKLSEQFRTEASRFDKRQEDIEKILEERHSIIKQEVALLRQGLDSRINRIKTDIHDIKGHVWKLRGSRANALRSFLSTAFFRLKENSPLILSSLDDIREVLSEMDDINNEDLEKLKELIAKSPEGEAYKNITAELTELYEKLPVYEFLDEADPTTGNYWRYI